MQIMITPTTNNDSMSDLINTFLDNRKLKRLIRKKGRRFKKTKKPGMDEDMARYLDIEQMGKHELWDAERVHVNGTLQNGLESANNKPFWKYV